MKKVTAYTILAAITFGLVLVYILKNNLSNFKRKVLNQSNLEADKWLDYDETSSNTSPLIQDYWDRGANANYTLDQIEDVAWQNSHPWSAAYISWVMKVSGAGRHFLYSQRHADYVRDSIDQRELNPKAKFKGYRISEEKPEITDIVCRRRLSSQATYDNVPVNATLHCDIVTKVNKTDVEVIGGNIDNKVKRGNLSLDTLGYLNEANYFIIIKNTL